MIQFIVKCASISTQIFKRNFSDYSQINPKTTKKNIQILIIPMYKTMEKIAKDKMNLNIIVRMI